MKTLPFTIPQDLSAPVALALFELLQELTDALWQQYEIELIELIMEDRNQCPSFQQAFYFNDDLSF